ncbi:MAG: CHASE domain-containing protein [Prolixibacteraceae bacterium]|nr:CHASE domain-containing protein [Prolixibacteraceae bacterium]
MLKIRLFPIIIFLIGLCITIYISYSSLQGMKQLYINESEKLYYEFETKIQIQLNANAQVLYSSAAFISSSDTITRDEWKEFQTLNKSITQLPGVQGIGYLTLVSPQKLNEFEQKIRGADFPDFKLWPQGERNMYSSVLYLEPFEGRNVKALGYDGYSEPIRRKAMDLSRDSDKVILTDKIFLIQDMTTQKSPGTIMFAPVFISDAPKHSIEERKSAIKGWVFSPFRMDNLLKGILGNWNFQEIRLRVYDNNLLVPEKLLFDSDSVYMVKRASGASSSVYNLPMTFNDKVWTLQFLNYNVETSFLSKEVINVLLLGTLISILLFVLTFSLINAKSKNHRIQHLNEELKRVNLSKDRFISVLAHDLKSPFNSLLGFSEVLSENINDLSKNEIEEFARNINTSAQGTYLLLEELLLWARVQTDHFPFTPKIINLFDICNQVIEDHKFISQKKNISVLNEIDSILNVKADELMLKTILRNLFSNAIKFTSKGGQIKLTADRSKNNRIVMSVIDNGIGMTSIEVSDLFNISTMHSKMGTANEKGTGMGLLLCKDLVLKHEGNIWVESSPGKGSQFSFTLPEG